MLFDFPDTEPFGLDVSHLLGNTGVSNYHDYNTDEIIVLRKN